MALPEGVLGVVVILIGTVVSEVVVVFRGAVESGAVIVFGGVLVSRGFGHSSFWVRVMEPFKNGYSIAPPKKPCQNRQNRIPSLESYPSCIFIFSHATFSV